MIDCLIEKFNEKEIYKSDFDGIILRWQFVLWRCFFVYKKLEDGSKKVIKIGIFLSILIFVLTFVFEGIIVGVTSVFITNGDTGLDQSTITNLALMAMIFGKLFAMYMMIVIFTKRNSEVQINPVVKDKGQIYLYCFAVIVGYRFFADHSLSYLMDMMPVSEALESFQSQMEVAWLPALVLIVFIAPLVEEVIFRGIMLEGLLKKYDYRVAVFISALLFAVMHFNWIQGVNTFVLGLVISYVYYLTRSVKVAIVVHFMNNFGAFFPQIRLTSSMNMNLIISVLGIALIIFAVRRIESEVEEIKNRYNLIKRETVNEVGSINMTNFEINKEND